MCRGANTALQLNRVGIGKRPLCKQRGDAWRILGMSVLIFLRIMHTGFQSYEMSCRFLDNTDAQHSARLPGFGMLHHLMIPSCRLEDRSLLWTIVDVVDVERSGWLLGQLADGLHVALCVVDGHSGTHDVDIYVHRVEIAQPFSR